MDEAKEVKLRASARVVPEGLRVDYQVENTGKAPVYVMNLDFYSGKSAASVQRLRGKEAFVFFGTPTLPQGLFINWPPRPAGVPLPPQETLTAHLELPLPLQETGMSPRPFAPEPSDEPPEELPIDWLYLALELRPAPRKKPPKAACGAFDLYTVDVPKLYVTATTDIQGGPCTLLRMRDGVSMIDSVLPRELQRK
jgi:hypothetical protein